MEPEDLSHDIATPREQTWLYLEQVDLLYKNAPIALAATIINSVALCFVLRTVISKIVLVGWLAVVLATALLRFLFVRQYRKAAPEVRAAKPWDKWFFLNVVCAGIVWGMSGIFLFAEDSLIHQTFLAFVLGGMVAGAAVAFSPAKEVFFAFMIPTVSPFALELFLQGGSVHLTMGCMTVFFMFLMGLIAVRFSAISTQSSRLRFLNNGLIANLQEAKERAETLVLDLQSEINERKRIENALRKAHDELERRVAERTKELRDANSDLQLQIAERKCAEEELIKIGKAVESAGDAISMVDLTGKSFYHNKSFGDLFEFNSEELKRAGGPCGLFVDASLSHTVLDALLRGESWSGDVEMRSRSGRTLPIAFRADAIRGQQGRIIGLLCFCSDITERKRAEQALRESEAKFRALTETTPSIIFIVRGEKFLYVNPAFLKTSGLSMKEALEMNFWDVAAPDMREEVKRRGLARQKGEDVPSSYEIKVMTKGGGVRWASYTAADIEYRGLPAVLGTAFDITDRKRAEAELRESENRFREMTSLLPSIVCEFDTDLVITYANKAGFEAFGFTQEACEHGILVMDLVHRDDRSLVESKINSVIQRRKRESAEFRMLTKDNTVSWVIAHGAPIVKQEKIVGIRCSVVDVTEQRKIEEELLRAQKLESVGLLAGGIAHDFNNILLAMAANIDLAKMSINPEEKAYARLIQAESACLRAKGLAQQLLTFSKGGLPVKKPLSLALLIKEVAGFALSGSDVRCEFSLPDDLWAVEGDEGQIHQALNNLIINADQAMPDGGILEISAANTTLTDERNVPLKPGRYVEVQVRDHGIGIKQEHLNRVFDPYFSTKQKGSGLGLASVYSIVKKHGGHLTVRSELGVGTTFHIFLPASEQSIQAPEASEEKVQYGQGKVLLMDDEEIVREVAGKILEHLGYQAVFAADGAEALALHAQARQSGQPFDVIIMDLTIPGGMGGLETIGLLREADPDCKVIVSSGYSSDPVMSSFKDYGFDAVVAKPYQIKKLGDVLHKLTAAKKV